MKLTSNGQALIIVGALIIVYVLSGPALNLIDAEKAENIVGYLIAFIGGGVSGRLVGKS